MKQKVVILTGAGISAESGLQTFRDSDGLWEGYNVQDVATPQAWQKDPILVQKFYNERRKACLQAKPNAAHLALQKLETSFDVQIITQNIDDLHERAGSSNVLHLHGEITKSCSCKDRSLIYDIKGSDLQMGELCEKGSQLRPFIVWFGEDVPMMEPAIEITKSADYFIVIGTSLAVYPAASLLTVAPYIAELYLIDPKADSISVSTAGVKKIAAKATVGVPQLVKELVQ